MFAPRPAALVAVLVLPALALAQLPADPVARQLTAQAALATAKGHLAAGRPADAAAALEAALPCAAGDPAFLDALRQAYTQELAADPAPARAATLAGRMKLIAGTPAPKPADAPDPAGSLRQATALFKQGGTDSARLADAAKFFAGAFGKVRMNPDQLAAWAFCRVRVAFDRLNGGADPAEVVAEVTDALKLAPDHAGVQERGAAVIAAARAKAPAAAGDGAAETANFLVRAGSPDQARAAAAAAEEHRAALFARWSASAAPAWGAKCEVTVHATAAEFQRATGTAGTGHAAVTLDAGRPAARRVHVRADDPTVLADALPRELAHVVLADLFPDRAPPEWAAVGVAALATSPAEQGRYLRTLDRCAATNEAIPAAQLVSAPAPADRVTAFHVQSLAAVQHLAALKGGPAFVEFVALSGRYGVAGAMKKVYGTTPASLDALWPAPRGH